MSSPRHKRTLVDEASDPETAFQRLLQLSESESAEVRRALVDNPSIAVDEDGKVRDLILFNLAEEFPGEVVACSAFALFGMEMKEKAMVDVAKFIAHGSKDPGVLNLLFHEFCPDDVDVGWHIAKNPNTPMDVLRLMADKNNEYHWAVRENVAKNPNTPEDALRFMADKNNEPEAYVRAGVAKNPKTPLDVLRFMADKNNEPDWYVRGGMAGNPNTPPDVLRFLADETKEPEAYVREGVARNPNTPPDVLSFMANETNEPDPFVRNSATEAMEKRGLQ